jgi:LysM repeat protein
MSIVKKTILLGILILTYCLLPTTIAFSYTVATTATESESENPKAIIPNPSEEEEIFLEEDSPSAQSEASSPEADQEQGFSQYVVKSGDCLWKIAQRLLGDGSRYPEIVAANKSKYPSLEKNPDLIYSGWVLDIPNGSNAPKPATIAENPSSTTQSSSTSSGQSNNSDYNNTSVIGKAKGDGTASGAISWSKDQLSSGTQKGVNSNNGKRTSAGNSTWDGWCLAFVGTSYGREIPELRAASAIKSYRNFKNAGKITVNRNPPPGAVIFTGTYSGNPYGHIFMAIDKKTKSGEPMVITTSSRGIQELPLSTVIGWSRGKYLCWAMP